ncbi:hypothetical protein WICMUC_000183 [Wickerhamomyces mucosus]|uniref:YEATS domain-containing protein n=1 Tax=Wickerhamomyces mucosus TaxID=1378264 RepID=A0A9P8Q015_9ASCO|nr:hypothetical protein WICMUC_000183 [Wickerhamomyces mucosus]
MSEVERTIRIITNQKILENEPKVDDTFPMREWSIEIFLLSSNSNSSSNSDNNNKDELIPATIFDKVTYHLHPTFVNPNRSLKSPPFKIQEKGWGEFELFITLNLLEKSGERKISHDLNFQQNHYEIDHKIKIPLNKSINLKKILLGDDDVSDNSNGNGNNGNGDIESNKRKISTQDQSKNIKKSKSNNLQTPIKGNIDLEKLAENLTKLNEDDLLGVVQMVTDNRTSDMNITNNVDEGEFTMDLYTLPDQLLKSLWDYVKKRIE